MPPARLLSLVLLILFQLAPAPCSAAAVARPPDALVVNVSHFEGELTRPNRNERYLAYLPHSGFHNQRIALENALTLAHILNRTLIIPPVRLGAPIPYRRFNDTYLALAASAKDAAALARCAPPAPPTAECAALANYTHVAWPWLVNLTALRPAHRFVHESDLSYGWLRHLRSPAHTRTGAALATLADTHTYTYRFVDGAPAAVPANARYTHRVPLAALAASPAHILQLGSLFGSARLHLAAPAHAAVRARVRRAMVPAPPLVAHTAAAARALLGGTYLGAHLRVGGAFAHDAHAHARAAWFRLVMHALRVDRAGAHALERRLLGADAAAPPPPELPADAAAQRTPHPPLLPLPPAFAPRLPCARALHTEHALRRLNVPLFVATDSRARAPPADPVLGRFWRTFPCVFVLDDVLAPRAEWARMRSAHDGLPLAPFLRPFADAAVVAGARLVVGVPGSTYSRFVEDVLWRVRWGFDVVERG